jgi:hypothetical protein
MRSLLCIAAFAFVALPMAGQAGTNLVPNGSFEAVQIGAPFFSTNPADIPGWTKSGPQGDALLWAKGYFDGGGSITTTGDGNQFVTLGCGFQNFSCGTTSWSPLLPPIFAPGQYKLQFDLAAEMAGSTQAINVSLSGAVNTTATFSAFGSGGANYWRAWETKDLLFTIPSPLQTFPPLPPMPLLLTFSATNLPFDVGLDNVQIFAVPEPQTYAMLLAGIAMLGFAARRRFA